MVRDGLHGGAKLLVLRQHSSKSLAGLDVIYNDFSTLWPKIQCFLRDSGVRSIGGQQSYVAKLVKSDDHELTG
jgi:hypothetical protein